MLGIDPAYNNFDTDIIIGINSALMRLNTLGIGNDNFTITSNEDEWGDFINTDINFESVKTYVYLKTRLVFDPPTSGTLTDLIKSEIAELEWILNVVNEEVQEA